MAITQLNNQQHNTFLQGMWIPDIYTWVYASASTFTVAGVDVTAIFTKGTRIKWKEGATQKYGVVVLSAFSTNTTVTIAVNTDYVLTNTTLSSVCYSYAANPQGYPNWFAYTTTYSGFSANPTYPFRFSITGNTCIVAQDANGAADGTSNATTYTFTLPVAPRNLCYGIPQFGKDAGTNLSTPCQAMLTNGSTTVNLYKTFYNGAWTASGLKGVFIPSLVYEF